jgi:hypothetical protein
MVNKSEKLAEAKSNFASMIKAIKNNDVESIKNATKAMNTDATDEG